VSDIIVCAVYEPRETHLAVRLSRDLENHRHEMSIIQVPTMETTTKPGQILDALHRHPDQMVVMLDIDARVVATLNELPLLVRGDIGMVMRAHFQRRGWRPLPPRFAVRTGLIAARQTPGARRFLATWDRLIRLRFGEIDRSPASLAVWESEDVSFSPLPARFAATRLDGLLFATVEFY